jgi:hypothetical protein
MLSADNGFPPALLTLGRALIDGGDRRNGFAYLETAATVYRDTVAASELAFLRALSDKTRKQGLAELRALADRRVFEANRFLGKLYSPFCPETFPGKDAQTAMNWFHRASLIKRDGDCLYEIARVFYHGAPGVPKQEIRAQDWFKRAKQGNTDMPPLDFVARENVCQAVEVGSSRWTIGAVGGIIGVVAGVFLWRWRRHRG